MATLEAFERMQHGLQLAFDNCSTSQDRINLIACMNDALESFQPVDLSHVKLPMEIKTKGRPKMLKGARSSSAFEHVEKELASEQKEAKKQENAKKHEKRKKQEKAEEQEKAKGTYFVSTCYKSLLLTDSPDNKNDNMYDKEKADDKPKKRYVWCKPLKPLCSMELTDDIS